MDDITNAFTKLCDETFAFDGYLRGQLQPAVPVDLPHQSGIVGRLERARSVSVSSTAEPVLRPSRSLASAARSVMLARAFVGAAGHESSGDRSSATQAGAQPRAPSRLDVSQKYLDPQGDLFRADSSQSMEEVVLPDFMETKAPRRMRTPLISVHESSPELPNAYATPTVSEKSL
jgi:hypothetical protein